MGDGNGSVRNRPLIYIELTHIFPFTFSVSIKVAEIPQMLLAQSAKFKTESKTGLVFMQLTVIHKDSYTRTNYADLCMCSSYLEILINAPACFGKNWMIADKIRMMTEII